MMENRLIGIKNKLEEGVTFKMSRFKEVIKKTKPHKHDHYYELIFLNQGEGFHTIESEKYMVQTPEIYFLKPGQLHYWQFTSVPRGFVLIFREDEFDALNETRIIELYKKLLPYSRVMMHKENYPSALLESIFLEASDQKSFSRDIIHGLFTALLGMVVRTTEESEKPEFRPDTFYEKFQSLLINKCPELHKVHQFASLLHTTPQNLNAICQKHVGTSASSLINSRLMLEAKRYILHTNMNISEIAHILNFSDSSNFVKFFRNHEHKTPLQFREQFFK
jgi:AraC family transcriptional regulator, transcriptional activator of pobA